MRLHHELYGPQDAPVLLLGSSLGASTEMWDPQIPALAEHHRIVRFDLRGHGGTPAPPGPYALSELAGDVLEMLDELQIGRCSFCGVSLGGMLGQWLAAHAPERIDRLVVCASSPHLPPAAQWLERAAAVREAGTVDVVAEAVVQRWLTPSFAAEHPDVRAQLRAMLVASAAEGYAGCCEAIAAVDLRGDLASIAAPTLVICGAEDPVAPALGHGELIAAGVQRGRLRTLSPGAHLVSIEQAARVTQLIADHLAVDTEEEQW